MKFFIDNIWLILLALLSGGALAWPGLTRSKLSLSILQATYLINKDKATVLDVRTSKEFDVDHILSAKNIPLVDILSRKGEIDKSHPVLVVCSLGARSVKGAAMLKSAGFTEVYSLEGGFEAWKSQGLPTSKSSM